MNGFMEGEEQEEGQEERTPREEGRDLQDKEALSLLYLLRLPWALFQPQGHRST